MQTFCMVKPIGRKKNVFIYGEMWLASKLLGVHCVCVCIFLLERSLSDVWLVPAVEIGCVTVKTEWLILQKCDLSFSKLAHFLLSKHD